MWFPLAVLGALILTGNFRFDGWWFLVVAPMIAYLVVIGAYRARSWQLVRWCDIALAPLAPVVLFIAALTLPRSFFDETAAVVLLSAAIALAAPRKAWIPLTATATLALVLDLNSHYVRWLSERAFRGDVAVAVMHVEPVLPSWLPPEALAMAVALGVCAWRLRDRVVALAAIAFLLLASVTGSLTAPMLVLFAAALFSRR